MFSTVTHPGQQVFLQESIPSHQIDFKTLKHNEPKVKISGYHKHNK
jgi:hypothetical protein